MRRVTTDIDVVGLDKAAKKAVLGECKYRNELIDKKRYEDLLEKNGLISKEYTVVQFKKRVYGVGGRTRFLANGRCL